MFSPEFSIQASFYGSCFHQIYIWWNIWTALSIIYFSNLFPYFHPSIHPSWNFPSGPTVKTLHFYCRSMGLILVGRQTSYKANSVHPQIYPSNHPLFNNHITFHNLFMNSLLTVFHSFNNVKGMPCHPYLYTRSTISMG